MTKILIADDYETNLMVLSKLFTHHGFDVVEAPDGATALELMRTERPDVALVDLLMPVVDGFEFVHRLRREEGPAARTPVVFITAAYLPAEVLPLAESCGVYHVLSRPATFEETLRVVNNALHSVPPPGEAPPRGEFTLGLLRLLSSTVTKNIRSVIPALAEAVDPEVALNLWPDEPAPPEGGEPAPPPGEPAPPPPARDE